MEDEKTKKKRNKKKKKNKAAAEEDGNVSSGQNDHLGRVPEVVSEVLDADSKRHYSNGIEPDSLIVAEKQQWMQRETALQETIKQLRSENDSYGHTQTALQERIKQLLDKTDSHLQKEAALEDTVKKLREANHLHIQKEASLEEKLDRLLGEEAALVLNVESLKEKVMQLESQKIYWTQTEESLKEKVMQLESLKTSWTQTEESLKEKVMQLESQKTSWTQTEESLKERVMQLESQKTSLTQREESLKEKVMQLENQKTSWTQTEESLKEKVMQLESQKTSLTQTEESLNEKVMQLESQKTYWTQTEESLNERVMQLESQKNYWTRTEEINKDTVSKMNVDITKLQMQVVELEESRNSLLKENQELMEHTSSLQLQLQNLETSIATTTKPGEFGKPGPQHEDLKLQIEASLGLVDRLVTENAELVEKVNELYIKLERQSPGTGLPSTAESDGMNGDSNLPNGVIPLSRSIEKFPASDDVSGSLEVEPSALPYVSETDSADIVQIPLDDTETQNLQVQVVGSDEMEKVTLSDAPLIGAPFRLVSFFANYVSGADLVNKNAVNLEP